MSQETKPNSAEAEIHVLLTSWEQAASAGNLDAIMSHYAPDIISYDAMLALQFKGLDAYRKHWQMCLTMCSAMSFKTQDLHIAVSGDVAFSHCLNRCGGTDKNGKENASWMRMTSGYRKINGQWKIVHEHFSAPFDMDGSKPLFDLQP
jgi:ketosteroid isomerase-like protein